jgi:hypothetical protein
VKQTPFVYARVYASSTLVRVDHYSRGAKTAPERSVFTARKAGLEEIIRLLRNTMFKFLYQYLPLATRKTTKNVTCSPRLEPGTHRIRLVFVFGSLLFVVYEKLQTDYLHHNFSIISFLIHLRSTQIHYHRDQMFTSLPATRPHNETRTLCAQLPSRD